MRGINWVIFLDLKGKFYLIYLNGQDNIGSWPMILVGYASSKLQKICTAQKEARKALPQKSADLVTLRMNQLVAFANLGQIPFRAPPLHFHPLREDASGKYVVKLAGGDGIVFFPVGTFTTKEDGSPDLDTVTEIEIEFVGNYHANA